MKVIPSFLNRYRYKFGALGILILMLPMILWVSLTVRAPVLSVLNGSVPNYVLSGKMLSEPFDKVHAGFVMDQPTIGKWLFLFSFMAAISLPYTLGVRWLANRRKKAGYLAYAFCTLLICLTLLCILTWPLIWLIQYVHSMGFTPKRICGLLYTAAGAFLVTGVLLWAFRKPHYPPTDS